MATPNGSDMPRCPKHGSTAHTRWTVGQGHSFRCEEVEPASFNENMPMTDPMTPRALPDEAALRDALVDLLRAEFDQGHMMVMEPIAERILAALAPTVAASEAVEGDWMGPVVLSESRPATVREVPYVGVSFTDEDAPSPATEAERHVRETGCEGLERLRWAIDAALVHLEHEHVGFARQTLARAALAATEPGGEGEGVTLPDGTPPPGHR